MVVGGVGVGVGVGGGEGKERIRRFTSAGERLWGSMRCEALRRMNGFLTLGQYREDGVGNSVGAVPLVFVLRRQICVRANILHTQPSTQRGK